MKRPGLAFLVVVLLSIRALPVVAQAQPAAKVPLIGVLSPGGSPPGSLEAFREGLRDLGYVEGRTTTWALDPRRHRALACVCVAENANKRKEKAMHVPPIVKVTVAMSAVLLALGGAVEVAAEPLAPTRASDVVTLRSSGTACAVAPFFRLFDIRVLPDGKTEPFSLPTASVLVVTGVDWVVTGAPANSQIELVLYVEADPATVTPVLVDRGDSSGGAQVFRSTTTSPIVVKGPLCAGSNTTVNEVSGVVHGFIAQNK